jgi:hypothetical protein
MKALKWILTGVVFSLCSAAFAGQSSGIVVAHYDALQRLTMRSAGAATGQELSATAPMMLGFDALGRSFDLDLQPNDRFLSTASRSALPGGIGIYRGQLAGNPDSWARIVVYDGAPRGLVWDGKQMYAIEAPGDSAVNESSPVIYRLADTFIDPGTMTCGSESLSGNGAAMYGRLVDELTKSAAQAAGAVSEIDIGTVADFEFTTDQGDEAAARAAIITRMNMVDGIFSQEIGVQINHPPSDIFVDSADPFSESDAGLLLDELTTYRANTPSQDSLGLTHLWTGRDLDGSTVGIAWNDVLCRSGVGSGLSEGNGTAVFDSLVAAHEIGHNFGAPHDGDPMYACGAEPLDFIMAPTLNINNNTFSDCSKTIMEANAAAAACVTALPAVDVSVTLTNPSSAVLLGTSPSFEFDITSHGTLAVNGVVADFTLPASLTVDSVSSSAGTCTTVANDVSCDIGNVPGLTVNTVSIDTTAATVGAGMIDATVTTTDVDERPNNNQYSQALTVNPAVDLVVNSPSTVTVNLDQSATTRAPPENRSTLDATGVTLSISFGSGVQADSASWALGNCTVAVQQVDCVAANFAAQSNSTLTVGVTGLSAGARNYTVTMDSIEADADPSNNNANGTVTVNDPAQESSGGALGLPFLCLLGLASFMTRRRRIGA